MSFAIPSGSEPAIVLDMVAHTMSGYNDFKAAKMEKVVWPDASYVTTATREFLQDLGYVKKLKANYWKLTDEGRKDFKGLN